MPDRTRIVAPGPSDCTVRTADGQILDAPADWELLPPGDATLTRRVKAAGPTWTVQVKKGRKRREVRRTPAEQSRRLLEKYRAGREADPTCPLQQALASDR